jgi:uncharacterized Zn finger protein
VSHWDNWGWYKPAPKKPPPEHGIKMKSAGTTWWGQRWIEALQNVLRGDSARLARGRTYARAGRAHDLVVHDGVVTAKVTGSRPTPYKITIELAQLPDAAWKGAIAAMAGRAQFAADLLAGQMPKEIDELFRATGNSLFPEKRADLTTSCSCPDWGDPCKHVAATHYVLGEALDRDPFLLFELRGRTKEQVLDALRAARGGETQVTTGGLREKGKAKGEHVGAAPEIPKTALGTIKPADYDRPKAQLPAPHFSFDAPLSHGALLRQLGTPPTWKGAGSPADALAPLVHAAAAMAQRIATAEAEPPGMHGDEGDAGGNGQARRRSKARATRRSA